VTSEEFYTLESSSSNNLKTKKAASETETTVATTDKAKGSKLQDEGS